MGFVEASVITGTMELIHGILDSRVHYEDRFTTISQS